MAHVLKNTSTSTYTFPYKTNNIRKAYVCGTSYMNFTTSEDNVCLDGIRLPRYIVPLRWMFCPPKALNGNSMTKANGSRPPFVVQARAKVPESLCIGEIEVLYRRIVCEHLTDDHKTCSHIKLHIGLIGARRQSSSSPPKCASLPGSS